MRVVLIFLFNSKQESKIGIVSKKFNYLFKCLRLKIESVIYWDNYVTPLKFIDPLGWKL